MLKTLGRSLGALPREARDTLFLLAGIAWVVLLQTGHVPAWTSVATLATLAWRAWSSWRGHALPSWPYRLGALGLVLAATLLTHHTLLGKDAGVTLVTCLLALKTLEMRARRDAFVIFFLGFFTLLTHLFFSQSMLSAIGIVIGLLGLLAGLVNAHMPVGHPPLKRSVGVAARLAAAGTPIMIVLFALFPRVAPLWALPTDEQTGRSGLSDEMEVGQVARLALNDEIAFRVRFSAPRPPERLLYFRGPVLSRFDGKTWSPSLSASRQRGADAGDIETDAPAVDYVVLMEPHSRPWIYTLDLAPGRPQGVDPKARLSTTGLWLLPQPVGQVMQYTARSFTSYRLEPRLDEQQRRGNLYLPRGSNPRTVELASTLRTRVGTGAQADEQLIDEALKRLQTGGYTYTLEPGLYGQHTADEFWFDRKEGFCEHIASSFVILMRASGIPARVVTGYQGGSINGIDGSWAVRQRDAHAWAEVWKDGQGWVRIDPTGMVAPGRIGSLSTLRTPPSGIEQAVLAVNPDLVARWRDVWDAVDATWKRWVVDYNQNKQLDLLKRLGFEAPNWADLGYLLAILLAATTLAGALWAAWERRQQDPWLRLLAQAQARLSKAGWAQAELATTPRALARQLEQEARAGEFVRQMVAWLHRMEQLRYARQSDDTLGKLKSELSRMHWPQRRS